jgi:hypothetical protein
MPVADPTNFRAESQICRARRTVHRTPKVAHQPGRAKETIMTVGTRFIVGLAVIAYLVAPSAEAAPILRSVNATLTAVPDGPNNFYDLDVDLDGTTDFGFTTIIGIPEDPTFASFAVVEAPFGSQNGARIDAFTGDGFPTVSRLALGDTVSATDPFFLAGFEQGNLFFVTAFDPPSGNFQSQTGFIGLRFERDGALHYGFAQVTVNDLFAAQDPLAVTIGIVGFESVAGAPVQVQAIPEPASLAAFGLAVVGLAALRRRT